MSSVALIGRPTADPTSHVGEKHESATFRLAVPRPGTDGTGRDARPPPHQPERIRLPRRRHHEGDRCHEPGNLVQAKAGREPV